MSSQADHLANLMFRAALAALVVFVILGGLGVLADPPLARRADPVAQVWQWLILSSVAAGGLTGLVAFLAAVIAAVSRRSRPTV